MDRIATAASRARELAAAPVSSPPMSGVARAQWFAVGDPQASLERFLGALDRVNLLGDDGWLRADVGLLSIGDHFDYGRDPEEASASGTAILHWLAAHPPDQVVILAGNHDISRVGELAFETDASFTAARMFSGVDADFFRQFPKIPTRELAARDYSGFTEHQRRSVQSLLMNRRFALAAVADVAGAQSLFVHAGFTRRDLDIIGVTDTEPTTIALGLQRFLDERVARVSDAWLRGDLEPLDLEPLHIGGCTGIEGGGLLYQRPANLKREGIADPVWERDQTHPRRYDPRVLIPGLVLTVGHTSHKKCLKELTPWCTEAAQRIPNGGLRTLRSGESIIYDVGIQPAVPGEATVYMIDPSMSDDTLTELPLLPIGAPVVPR